MSKHIAPLASLLLLTSAAWAAPPGEAELSGHNLSTPVIFPDGVALDLRGEPLTETLDGAYTLIDGVKWYHQDDPANEWQAESLILDPNLDGPLYVHWVDWSDNLEARAWTLRSKVRVEVTLLQDLEAPMVGYQMLYLAGTGRSELWGSNGAQDQLFAAHVYSPTARLVIQKLTVDPDTANLEWDTGTAMWTGDALAPVLDLPAWEAVDGMGGFGAEVNVSGRVIYGLIWDARRLNNGEGIYRLTFVLDDVNYPGTAGTFFDEYSSIVPFGEETEEDAPVGGVPSLAWEHNLTWIDVLVVSDTGKGGGGGGGGGRPDDPGSH